MHLKLQPSGKIINVRIDEPIARGGEGSICAVVHDDERAAKIYHRETEAQRKRMPEREAKILCMMNAEASKKNGHKNYSLALPLEILYDAHDETQFRGFIMHRAMNAHSLSSYYKPDMRQAIATGCTYAFLFQAARHITLAIERAHEQHFVIGDLNGANILVNPDGDVTLVDTDSFQVIDLGQNIIYRCPVGKKEYTPPELQRSSFSRVVRKAEHDLFPLAIILFHILMEGHHPFAGTSRMSVRSTIAAHIQKGLYTFSSNFRFRVQPPLAAPPIDLLPMKLRELFVRCFEIGLTDPSKRPSIREWYDTLSVCERDLVRCEIQPQHFFGNHLSACPWCDRKKMLQGIDPFPIIESI